MKITDFFTEEKYAVTVSYGMPYGYYEIVDICEDVISRDLFIAMFKLFCAEVRFDARYESITVSHEFSDPFGVINDDGDAFDELWESIEKTDVELSTGELKAINDYLLEILWGVEDNESALCSSRDYDEDDAIKNVIKNHSFVIYIGGPVEIEPYML